jgi:hypothetical protein
MTQSTAVVRPILYFESRDQPSGKLPTVAIEACRYALKSIQASKAGAWRLLVRSADAQHAFALQLARDSGFEAEAITGDGSEWRASADANLVLYAGERPAAPATLGTGAAPWSAVRSLDGQAWEADVGGHWQPPSWLDDTLTPAGVSLDESVETIFKRSDALAQSTAPDTRRSGKTLVAIEAICVLLPVVWLLRTPLNLPPMLAALAGLASPLLILVFFWWLRWRSMGRMWSRARLVAEACRSLLATRSAPLQPVVTLLSVVPALRGLLQKFAAEPQQTAPNWRADYLRDRIDNQHDYYLRQRDRALIERQKLTRWSTILMDVALAVGVAGIIVTLNPRSATWLTLLGGSWLEFGLGMAGLALPLGLLVAQSLRFVGESARRTARYTQQILHLENLRERFATANDEQALELLRETEEALLAEVLDWYFQSETTEDFYTIREQSAVVVPGQLAPRRIGKLDFLWRGLRNLGTAAGFIVRLVLGRMIWVVLSAATVLMWISLKQPETAEVASRLQELGRMLNPADGSMFAPDPIAAVNGTMIFTHGMRDGWRPPTSDFEHWTSELSSRIRARMGPLAPQMLVLDWREGAKASSQHGLNTSDPLTRFLADLGGARSSGQATGDFFGIRLVRMVENGQVRTDRPLHLIGHSAGGFVMARAAHILVAMGFPKERLHVTMLDTPEPDTSITQNLVHYAHAEFYRTSELTQVSASTFDPAMHFVYIPPPPAVGEGFASSMKQHSYAWKWYRDSIASAKCGEDGFGRSPFCE